MPVTLLVRDKDRVYDSPARRLKTVRERVPYMPAWKCTSLIKGTFYLCGRCFSKKALGAATSTEEIWMADPTTPQGTPTHLVVPRDARCHDCNGHAWPKD